MNKYVRRQGLRRFLNKKEDRKFICSNKRSFASKEEALDLQPSQRAYQCKTCGKWHLTAK